jgi:hypothetical protein
MLCQLVWIPFQCDSYERKPKGLFLFEEASNGVSIIDMSEI